MVSPRIRLAGYIYFGFEASIQIFRLKNGVGVVASTRYISEVGEGQSCTLQKKSIQLHGIDIIQFKRNQAFEFIVSDYKTVNLY